MKIAKLFSLGLVSLILFGCNQTPAANNNDNLIESNVSETQDSNPVDSANRNQTSKSNNSSSKITSSKKNRKNKTGKQIGPRFDCNGDGKANGVRLDYNDDGIPDECIESEEKAKSVINESSYQTALNSLESIIKGCQESTRTPKNTKYTICKDGEKIVKVSEYSSVAGAGLDIWLVDNRVIAVQRPHSQELFLFNNNGKLKSKFIYPKKLANISNQDRRDGESLYNSHNRIIAAFNNNSSGQITASTTQNNSSQNGIIDETSYQTISKSLDYITKGCQKIEKINNSNSYEICKKGNIIVNASEYNIEAGGGLVYWFSPDGKVVAARYLGSGETYLFDSNGKVSSKINVYESKKINNISAEDRKQAEESLYVNYKDILRLF